MILAAALCFSHSLFPFYIHQREKKKQNKKKKTPIPEILSLPLRATTTALHPPPSIIPH